MTRVFCSKKLYSLFDHIDNHLPADCMTRSLNNWNAQLFYTDRKKNMIFINNLTCYSIFILDLKKKDLPNISHIFKQRLKVQLQQDKIVLTSSEFDKIFEPVDMKFFKTNNDRKIIGTMSDLIYQFKGIRADNYTHIDSMDINYVNSNLNNIPYNNPVEAKKILSFPKENMKSAIAQQWRT